MTRRRYTFLILILGSLTALAPFSIDMYLPGFSFIAKDLQTSVSNVALSLSSFFIGVSFGQLLYGPLLDRFGRKRPLYIGLLIYLVTSLGCAFVTSIDALITLRFLQALGCCACTVTATAMVRDLFPPEDGAKVFSLLLLVLSVSPMLAPAIGGYVSGTLGWHAIFIILTVLAAAILAGAYFGLPQGAAPDPSYSLMPRPIINSFLSVVKEPRFSTYAFGGGIAFGGLFSYVSGSPYVFMELYKVTGTQFSLLFALIAVGFIGAGQVNTLLLKKYKSEQIVMKALICQVIFGILLVAGTAGGWLGLVGTIALIFVFLSSAGFIYPNAAALAMAPFSRNAGSASALMGALQMGLGSLATVFVSLLSDRTALPMTGVMAACAVAAMIIMLSGRKVIRTRMVKLKAAGFTSDMVA